MKKWIGVLGGACIAVWLVSWRGPEPAAAGELEAALGDLFTRFVQADSGVHVGMSVADLPAVTGGAAGIDGTYYLPLETTPFAPPAGVRGVLRIDAIENSDLGEMAAEIEAEFGKLEEEILDITLVFLVGDYDAQALGGILAERAEAIGVGLSVEEGTAAWWGFTDRGVVDVSCGKGVIAMMLTPLGDDGLLEEE